MKNQTHNVFWLELSSCRAKLQYPDTIRGKFGLTDTENSVHGSDSTENFIKEVKHVFPDFNYCRWLKEDKKIYHRNNFVYNATLEVHELK